MSVFLMAAGKGTRLAPLTDVLPKPAIPVANEPVMGRLLRLLARHGYRRVVSNISYKADVLQHVFGNGEAYGVELVWSRESELLGNAGGMRYAEELLRTDDGPVVVLSGDGLHELDIPALVRAHDDSGALATMALTPVDDPSEYGVTVLDDSGRIEGFQEKPAAGTELSNLANTGIYVFDQRIFELLPPSGTFYDFGENLFPALLEQGEHVHGVAISGYWNDVGGLDALRQGNLDVVRGIIAEEHPIDFSGDPHLVHPTSEVGSGVDLQGTCVIGPDAQIGDGARLVDSVVLPGATVPAGAIVAAAIYGGVEGLAAWADGLGAQLETAAQ